MSETSKSLTGTLETPKDAGKGEKGVVTRWVMEIDNAKENEKKWREKAKKALEVLRDEDNRTKSRYNILFANTEILKPNLYTQKPRPDVRQRYKKQDKVARTAAMVIEQSLNFLLDAYDFDNTMSLTVFDMIVPGRGVARVRFEPVIEQQSGGDDGAGYEQMTYATVECEQWAYDKFIIGPGEKWEEVSWICYEHDLKKDEIKKKFPGFEDLVQYDVTVQGVEQEKADKNPSIYKRVKVYEVWDKDERKVNWIAPTYRDKPLASEDDKLKLQGFFDTPRPLYSIQTTKSLVPIPEYEMYRDQAQELNAITRRITNLTESLKIRGIYDATLSEIQNLLQSNDNILVPSEHASIAMKEGGIERAIWIMPIGEIAKAIIQLYQQRDQIKQVIYEIIGLADIMRGSSDPSETLGAQELKAQTGSIRMKWRQKEVQRYIRDLLRIKAEIICEHLTPEILGLMTGIELPTGEQKQAAQQQLQVMAQQAQMTGQPPQVNPELDKIVKSPSWDEVMARLKNDVLRNFSIDIETDSTIAIDEAKDKQEAGEIITGIGSFIQNVGPAVQGGAMSMETAKKILLSVIRKAKLGRDVEIALDEESEKPQQPQEQKPDPAMIEMQQKAQLAEKEFQLKAQTAQQEMALKEKVEMQKLAIDQENKRAMAENASKPTTTVQFNAEDKLNGATEAMAAAAEALQQNVASNIQTQQVSQEAILAAIQGMTHAVQTLIQAQAAPKELVRDQSGRAIGVRTILH